MTQEAAPSFTGSETDVDLNARDARRAALTARYALIISIAGHSGQAVVFYLVDRPELSVLNIVSTALLAFALWRLLAARAIEFAWWLLIVEMAVNALLATVVLGIGAGFLVYPMIGFGIAFTIPFSSVWRRMPILIGGFTALIPFIWYQPAWVPTDPFDAETTSYFLAANLVNMALGSAVVLWYYGRQISLAERALAGAFARSEGLLVSILPGPMAERLKSGERSIADAYGEATVLFADIVGFTEHAAQMRPSDVVQMLDALFARFDAMADDFGVEKIKTIGDAYMAVSGLPEARANHAIAAAKFAVAMIAAAKETRMPSGEPIQLRIGLHSGPLVGGVIGTRRMTFDIWGDTVNTAARMESTGLPGRVQVSDSTYDLIRNAFRVEERGTVDVKGKGKMRTWLIA